MRKLLFATILLAPATAAAQPTLDLAPKPVEAPWHFGVAVRVALDVPTSSLGVMPAVTLEVDHQLPVADHRLGLALSFGWTRPSHDGTVDDPRVGGMQTYQVHETEVAIGLDATFRVRKGAPKLAPWIAGGPLLVLLGTKETTTAAPGANTEQSTKLGFDLAGGADLKLGPGYALGELRVSYAGLDHHLTGDTNAGNVVIGAGYRLVF